MKSSLYFTMIVVMCSCAVSVRDKETPGQESELPTMNEVKLKEEFKQSQPDSLSIIAYNASAKEKLLEFFELCEVVSSQDVAKALKENAHRQAISLFQANGKIIYKNTVYTPADFLYHISDNQLSLNEVSDIQITEGFANTDVMSHNSQLTIHYLSQLDADHAVATLMQTKKTFGTKDKLVWGVYLTSIEIR